MSRQRVIFYRKRFARGFTLSELLIALAILGVIATFTIPKVLQSQQNQAWNASYKEALSMMSGAYEAYKLNNTVTASTKLADLTPYMNYVRIETTGTIDHVQGQATLTCSSAYPCFRLHNGSAFQFDLTNDFGYATTTNFIVFNFDPDGKVTDGTTNGPGKGISVDLFYGGRLSSGISRPASSQTCFNGTSTCATWGADTPPSWFSW